jgi:hypothetical protein
MKRLDLLKYVKQAVNTVPAVRPYLSENAIKAIDDYAVIRGNYWSEIYDSVAGYLDSKGAVTGYRNKASIAMSEAFTDTVYTGWQEVGAEMPLDEDTQAWLSGRIGTEREYIIQMFDRLKAGRETLDYAAEGLARADMYARTLDGIYAEAKMRGKQNATLVFEGDDGSESCPECQKMKGKRHTIKYILANNLIPRPGNDNFSCGGYRCMHYWKNPKTGEIYGGQ